MRVAAGRYVNQVDPTFTQLHGKADGLLDIPSWTIKDPIGGIHTRLGNSTPRKVSGVNSLVMLTCYR